MGLPWSGLNLGEEEILYLLVQDITIMEQHRDNVVTMLWQFCDNFVTMLWQCCDNVVTVATMWQHCEEKSWDSLPVLLHVFLYIPQCSCIWSHLLNSYKLHCFGKDQQHMHLKRTLNLQLRTCVQIGTVFLQKCFQLPTCHIEIDEEQ